MARLLNVARRTADWLLRPDAPWSDAVEQSALVGRLTRKLGYHWLDRNTDRSKLMINIGGGNFFRRHWKVLDCPSHHYRFLPDSIDYPLDLTSDDPFPFADGAVSFYFSSHTLEHVPQEHVARALNEIWRTLATGGAVRISVPDFDLAYAAALTRDERALWMWPGDDVEERFLDSFATYWKGKVAAQRLRSQLETMSKADLADYYTSRIPRASQREHPGHHINWWTYDKLAVMLKDAGFDEVYRSMPQQSRFAEMRGVGRNTGFDSTYPEISLFVEAIKGGAGVLSGLQDPAYARLPPKEAGRSDRLAGTKS